VRDAADTILRQLASDSMIHRVTCES
jgi:hypothetical protein